MDLVFFFFCVGSSHHYLVRGALHFFTPKLRYPNLVSDVGKCSLPSLWNHSCCFRSRSVYFSFLVDNLNCIFGSRRELSNGASQAVPFGCPTGRIVTTFGFLDLGGAQRSLDSLISFCLLAGKSRFPEGSIQYFHEWVELAMFQISSLRSTYRVDLRCHHCIPHSRAADKNRISTA